MGSLHDPVPVAVALGSNLGDREEYLRQAVSALAAIVDEISVSSLHETAPVGVGPQPLFLNAAVTGRTTLDAAKFLAALLEIEARLGRVRTFPGAPRTVDLDLILHGQTVIASRDLNVPHPRFRERTFVLAPLAELAGDWVDPVSGRTVAELYHRLATSTGEP
jgi:2-amino-4-hydroxy-6-hydroxymethyldihydropteridine diphosphokinase